MAFNLRNRSLLTLMHHSNRELRYLLDLSRDLKRAKYRAPNSSISKASTSH